MRDLLPKILEWQEDGKSVALATVVSAWGSSPRPLGSKMAISSSGDVAGSVSGGCVEGAVAEEAMGALASRSARLVSYGVSDDTAWSVGLSCGGRIEVFIEPIEAARDTEHRGSPDATKDRSLFPVLADRIGDEKISVRLIVLDGARQGNQVLVGNSGRVAGTLGSRLFDKEALALAREHIANLTCARRTVEIDSVAYDLFIDLHLPRPQLIVVGAVHVAIHLISLARRLGYRTIVIDPRTVFATPERFAEADLLLTDWPQEALAGVRVDRTTCFVFLSHDLKIDVPGLVLALQSPALYIGALGSRKTHAKRLAALHELGVPAHQSDRISAPIGLDLGGRRAEEIALAIMAEIVAVRYGKEGVRR
jgi:xanthine dehydrogenase accessory factor